MECHCTQVPVRSRLSPRGHERRSIGLPVLFSVCVMISVVSSAWGIDPIPNPESGAKVLVLRPVVERRQDNSGPKIILGGQPASPDDYPVSFQLAGDQGVCTWFLIGARTLMTAAHCVSDGAYVRIVKEQKTVYEGQCERSPKYSKDPSQDWALCLLSTDYPPPVLSDRPLTGYEVLNTDPSALQIAQRIQITGFGCEHKDGPLDDIYRVGWAKIAEVPPDVRIPGIYVRAPNFLKIKKLPSQLCSGDSGGPAFSFIGSSPFFRQVIGINAQTVYELGDGYLASTSTKDALDFFRQWEGKHGQEICGLHKNVKNCRPTRR